MKHHHLVHVGRPPGRRTTTLALLALAAIFGSVHANAAPAPAAKPEAAPAAETGAPPADPGWPRVIEKNGSRLTAYQPQIDDWSDYRTLRARFAFTLDTPEKDPVIGVASISGETTADLDSRTVLIRNLTITDARFPSLKEDEASKLEAALKEKFPKKSLTVSLDRLLAGTKISHENLKMVRVQLDPPPIYVSTAPALLLLVEGKPVLAPIEKTGLQFVVNTNWDLLFDPKTSTYYLLSGDEWLSSSALDKEWTLAGGLPEAIKHLPSDDNWKHVKESLPWAVKKGMVVPKVFYTDKPAELISFEGEPSWRGIAGTQLSWATNTDSHIFQDAADGKIYCLFSGRWFSTPKLGEAWTYAGNNLPQDFLDIPASDPCSVVLASVPGAEEAEDAVLLAGVPVQATIKKKEAQAKAKVVYQGDPVFQPIEGTQLEYAVNTSSDVIKYESKYYLCQDAVWFVSEKATGPWVVCTEVPPAIYQIPPSSPVYRTTYVTVEKSDNPDEAVYSYTAGYYGAFIAGVAVGECLMWGTGWYYPPYVAWGPYPAFYPYPRTYGAAAWYNPWTGGYAIGERVYGPYASAGRAAWYNPATGRYGRAAHVEGPWGGRTVAAGYNPRTNTGYVTHQGNNGFAQWGTSAVRRGDSWVRTSHINTADGGVARWHGSEGAGKFRWSDQGSSSIAVHDHDLYVGHDGNVYRKDPSGQWSKFDNGGWVPQQNPNNRPGANGGGTDHFPNRPDPGRPGANGGGEQHDLPRPNGPGPEPRPDRPETTRPAQDGGGVQHQQRPTNRVVDKAPQRQAADVPSQLDHESYARQRGEDQVERQRSYGGSSRFQGGGRDFGGGRGFQGGGGRFGGGGGFGGGGFRGRRR